MAAVPPPQLPIDALPAWATLQDVQLKHVGIRHIKGKGYGLVAESELEASVNTGDVTEIMHVPAELVLSTEAVEEYAKVDQNFRQLLEAAGQKSSRLDIMIYLLVHIVSGSHARDKSRRCASTAWSEYIKFLPRDVPVPTLWSEPHKLLLKGTSLEDALKAKLTSLNNEFDKLRDDSGNLPFWNKLFWVDDGAKRSDWFVADAWYRSRCLELPQAGHSMVPALDMVNHSTGSATAYYEEEATSRDVSLRVRPGASLAVGDEIHISYGDEKPAAEMLFSYGFIDASSATRQVTLQLDSFADDPLAMAKQRVFGGPRTVTFRQVEAETEGGRAKTTWESAFVYLACLNEEDGLEFRILQDDAGDRQLRLLWQGEDVTEQADAFSDLLREHPLRALIELRAVTVVQERAARQLERSEAAPGGDELEPLILADVVDRDHVNLIATLRDMERSVLEAVVANLEEEKSLLAEDESVAAYFKSIEQGSEETTHEEAHEEDDFS